MYGRAICVEHRTGCWFDHMWSSCPRTSHTSSDLFMICMEEWTCGTLKVSYSIVIKEHHGRTAMEPSKQAGPARILEATAIFARGIWAGKELIASFHFRSAVIFTVLLLFYGFKFKLLYFFSYPIRRTFPPLLTRIAAAWPQRHLIIFITSQNLFTQYIRSIIRLRFVKTVL